MARSSRTLMCSPEKDNGTPNTRRQRCQAASSDWRGSKPGYDLCAFGSSPTLAPTTLLDSTIWLVLLHSVHQLNGGFSGFHAMSLPNQFQSFPSLFSAGDSGLNCPFCGRHVFHRVGSSHNRWRSTPPEQKQRHRAQAPHTLMLALC